MDTITSAFLFSYGNKYGATREGAVLAAEPFCTNAKHNVLARLIFVTDDGHGGSDVINALGFLLEPGPIAPDHAPIVDALLMGRYATAVDLAGKLGILR